MRESRRRRQIALTVLLVAGLAPPIWPASAVAQTSSSPAPEKANERPLIGVKIYEPVADTDALLQEWTRLGIETAFVSTGLAESGTPSRGGRIEARDLRASRAVVERQRAPRSPVGSSPTGGP
jgi:hypothetical protein